MTPEQATFLAQQYVQLMQGEFPATCKVLKAVKDDTRGQLAAYLRGMGSKVPAIYGGSADEPMPGA